MILDNILGTIFGKSNSGESATTMTTTTTSSSTPRKTRTKTVSVEQSAQTTGKATNGGGTDSGHVDGPTGETSKEAAPKKKAAVKRKPIELTASHEAIAFRAFEIWQREGCPEGRETDHWLLAERELTGSK